MMIAKVTDKIYRGARPSNLEDYEQLKDAGVETILNLEEGFFEWFHHKTNQEFIDARLSKILPLHIQLGTFSPPTLVTIDAAVKSIHYSLHRGSVYVHCEHGVDRTGIVCACYRVRYQDWTVDAAVKEMYSMGFHKFPYQYLGWVNRLREYCGKYA